MNAPVLFELEEEEWTDAGRATLSDFIHIVANTPLKIKILATFLPDSCLCLASEQLAYRLNEEVEDIQRCARELSAEGAFHYCHSFAYSDLCSLEFQNHTPAIQYCLRLLKLGLRTEPDFVWAQVDAADLRPNDKELGR